MVDVFGVRDKRETAASQQFCALDNICTNRIREQRPLFSNSHFDLNRLSRLWNGTAFATFSQLWGLSTPPPSNEYLARCSRICGRIWFLQPGAPRLILLVASLRGRRCATITVEDAPALVAPAAKPLSHMEHPRTHTAAQHPTVPSSKQSSLEGAAAAFACPLLQVHEPRHAFACAVSLARLFTSLPCITVGRQVATSVRHNYRFDFHGQSARVAFVFQCRFLCLAKPWQPSHNRPHCQPRC